MKLRTALPQSTWRAEALFPPLPRTTSLEIVDLRSASFASKLSVATLAGLVNREATRLYLLENADDEFWLKEIDPALPCATVPASGDAALAHLLTVYREQVKGLVIYDPALPATVNLATTVAGLRGALAVSPQQTRDLHADLQSLPVLTDLRTYGWKNALQAYAWAYEHLLPECSRELVAGLAPTIPASLRAFLVTHQVFISWLDARSIWPSPALGWLSQRRLLKRILAHYSPGALHLGWFINEPFGVRLTSRGALLTLASDYCTNLEVWSNLPARETEAVSPEQVVSPPAGLQEQSQAQPGESERMYLSFTISDGDNLQYCQHRLLHLWNDPARGALPLGWTIAPALQHALPTVADFYRRSATRNDEFVAGPSGAGYVYPSYLPAAQREMFLRLTGEYMQAMRLSLLQVLDTNTLFSMKLLNAGLQKLFIERLRPYGLRGIFSGWGTACPSWRQRSGMPIYQNLGMAMNRQRTLQLIQHAAERGTRFIHVYIYAWNITPGDLRTVVEQLGDRFTVVKPGRLVELVDLSCQKR